MFLLFSPREDGIKKILIIVNHVKKLSKKRRQNKISTIPYNINKSHWLHRLQKGNCS